MWILQLNNGQKYWLSLARKKVVISAASATQPADIECMQLPDSVCISIRVEPSQSSHSSLSISIRSSSRNNNNPEQVTLKQGLKEQWQYPSQDDRDPILQISMIRMHVCVSTVARQTVDKIKSYASHLDYTFSSSFPSSASAESEKSESVTHLVMKQLTVTQKALQALQQNCFIVSEEFIATFTRYFNTVRSLNSSSDTHRPLPLFEYPDEHKHLPAFHGQSSSVLASFNWMPIQERLQLFKDVKFYCDMGGELFQQARPLIEGSRGVLVGYQSTNNEMDSMNDGYHVVAVVDIDSKNAQVTLDDIGRAIMSCSVAGAFPPLPLVKHDEVPVELFSIDVPISVHDDGNICQEDDLENISDNENGELAAAGGNKEVRETADRNMRQNTKKMSEIRESRENVNAEHIVQPELTTKQTPPVDFYVKHNTWITVKKKLVPQSDETIVSMYRRAPRLALMNKTAANPSNIPESGVNYKKFKKQYYSGKNELPTILPCRPVTYDFRKGPQEPWLQHNSPPKTTSRFTENDTITVVPRSNATSSSTWTSSKSNTVMKQTTIDETMMANSAKPTKRPKPRSRDEELAEFESFVNENDSFMVVGQNKSGQKSGEAVVKRKRGIDNWL